MLHFGVSGYPLAFFASPYRKDRLKIFPWLNELGIDALELQMTYGPRTTPENCRLLRAQAEKHGIVLSVHASYFIVLSSADEEKIVRSMAMLWKTYELAEILGARKIVLHPGPLYKEDPAKVLVRTRKNVERFLKEHKKRKSVLCLETAGKVGQLGGLEEILTLCEGLEGVEPCIDFGHLHARSCGGYKSEKEIREVFKKLKKFGALPGGAHFHYTPIHYGPRGELVHRKLTDTREDGSLYCPRPEVVAKLLKEYKVSGTVISECHDSQEEGARVLQEFYRQTSASASVPKAPKRGRKL